MKPTALMKPSVRWKSSKRISFMIALPPCVVDQPGSAASNCATCSALSACSLPLRATQCSWARSVEFMRVSSAGFVRDAKGRSCAGKCQSAQAERNSTKMVLFRRPPRFRSGHGFDGVFMIDISERAQQHFLKLLAQQGTDGLGIRLRVVDAGTPAANCELEFCERADLTGNEWTIE